jgi:hypothetical protein
MLHVREHRITQVSLGRRIHLEPFEYYLARRRQWWAGHLSRMPFSRLPCIFLCSWVDHKRPQQRFQFIYGHDLLRDLRKAGAVKIWDTLASNRNLWHAVTQQKNVHCNAAGGGYAWLNSEQLDQDSERPLPSLSSYAGFLLGLGSLSIKSSLSLLSNLPPLIRLIAPPFAAATSAIQPSLRFHSLSARSR